MMKSLLENSLFSTLLKYPACGRFVSCATKETISEICAGQKVPLGLTAARMFVGPIVLFVNDHVFKPITSWTIQTDSVEFHESSFWQFHLFTAAHSL